MSNYLGRCKQKGCDYALFATSEQVVDGETFRDVQAGRGAVRVGNNGVFGRCTNRHKFFPLKTVEGTYSEKHQCDSRCLNAKGNDCTCSCGGANHGRGYAVEIVTVEEPKPVVVSNEITERQAKFLLKLLDEHVIPAKGDVSGEERRGLAIGMVLAPEGARRFTKNEASKTISWLLTLPKTEEV